MITIFQFDSVNELRWFLDRVSVAVVAAAPFKTLFPSDVAERVSDEWENIGLAVAPSSVLDVVAQTKVKPGGVAVFSGQRLLWCEKPRHYDTNDLLVLLFRAMQGQYSMAEEQASRLEEVMAWLEHAGNDEEAEEELASSDTLESDPYDTLGILPNASKKEIKAAYYSRMQEYHPDKVERLGRRIKEVAEQETQRINAAYELLTGGSNE